MPCRVRDAGLISILDVEGNIDINSADIVEAVGWLLNSGKLKILCNLENVDMVDYSGLSILAVAYKNVVNHKGMMKFLHVPLPAMELFRIVRLDMVFDCYYDETAALASFVEETEVSRLPLRRRFKRLEMHLKVKYTWVSSQAKPAVFTGEVLNISGCGLFIYTKNTFPMNSPLLLALGLPGEPKPLEANAKEVWLPDKELQPHSYPGMGVSFTHLDNVVEKAIVDFVEKNVTYRAEE